MAIASAGPSRHFFEPQKGSDKDAQPDPLIGLLPPPGAASESPILQRLRRIEARAATLSPKETHEGRAICGDDELAWRDRSLLWSRGGQVMRSFTFQQDVVQACWAKMGPSGRRQRNRRRSHGSDSEGEHRSSFSAAQRRMRASWVGGNESANPASSSSSSTPSNSRQLVVILSDSFWIYYPSSGHEYTTAKNFKLAHAWPATSGVFLQRSLEAEDHRPAQSSHAFDAAPQLPTLFFLGDHLDEVTPVMLSGSLPAFTEDVRETIVFVHDEGHMRILVTVRPEAGEIRLYAYSIGAPCPSAALQPPQQAHHSASMTRSESAPSVPPKLGKGRPSMPRRSSRLSSTTVATLKSGSGPSAPPMTRRRSSRYPSTDFGTGNMSRIEETTFNRSVAAGISAAGPSTSSAAAVVHASSAAAAAAASNVASMTTLEQQEDAVEAEEMGQMVEGLARGKRSMNAQGDDSIVRRQSISNANTSRHHRRVSQMGRSGTHPYTTPRNISARHSTGRRRRSGEGVDLDLDPVSMSVRDGTFAAGEEDFSQRMGEDQATAARLVDHALGEHSKRATLQLIDVVRVEPWTAEEGNQISVFVNEDGQVLHVYFHAQGRLHFRTMRFAYAGKDKATPPPQVVAQGCVEAQGAAAVEVEAGRRQVVLLNEKGQLHLCLEDDPSGATLALRLDETSQGSWLLTPTTQHTNHGPSPSSMACDDGRALALTIASSSNTIVPRLNFAFSPREPTLCRLLSSSEVSTTAGAQLRRNWILAHGDSVSEWKALWIALGGSASEQKGLDEDDEMMAQIDSFGLLPPAPTRTGPATLYLDSSLRAESLRLLSILDAVAQDCRLDVTSKDVPRLAEIIVQLAAACGARHYADYWSLLVPAASTSASSQLGDVSSYPSDIFHLLERSVRGESHLELLNMSESQVSTVMPNFSRILRVLKAYKAPITTRSRPLGSDEEVPDSLIRSFAVANAMVRESLTPSQMDRLPWSLWLPLRLTLLRCASNPVASISAPLCRLLERFDLVPQHRETAIRYNAPESLRSLPTSGPRRLDPLSAMLFNKDYRLVDVSEMLETHRVAYVAAPAAQDKSDEELRELGLSLAHNVAERTKASSVGRGMFFFLTRPFQPTLRWTTPPLNRRILLRPAQPYHFPEPRAESVELDWPEFHNGAASALEMVVQGKEKVDSIWYFSQGQGERNARHAGLLLGLGLAGHFETIGQVHTYRYLGDRHGLTSIGLLLGLSATFAGRGDPDVRSLLACHVKAFLPEHSANLAHSTLVQAAALLGTGLLFMGADVSHIAEALCDQIGAQEIETTDPTMLSRAAYSLSAALGAGLVMLGRARRVEALTVRDKKLCRKLERYMVGAGRDALEEEEVSDLHWRVDERITSSTAAVAYALFFLKSNQGDAARAIPMPKDLVELDALRPDILLVHSVARNLIMWEAVQPTTDWLDGVLPTFLRNDAKLGAHATQVKVNLIAGACLALSFKYAGSASTDAKRLLLSVYHDLEGRANKTSQVSYDGRILHSTLRSSSDLIALALSIILAGTGDLDLLKILRPAHARIPSSEPYGSHMAVHMALGLLFLGGGRLTLGTSDAAVAAMLIAFYPRFPTKATDNRSHLQAYRHLWVLAVEPRLVVTQDVASGEMAAVPVRVRGQEPVMTPFQLPDLGKSAKLELDSDRYENTALESASQATRQRLLLKHKEGYLDYSRDPMGHRTAMARELAAERGNVGPESSGVLAASGEGEDATMSAHLRLLAAHTSGDDRVASALRESIDRNASQLLPFAIAKGQLVDGGDARDWAWTPRFLALLGLPTEPGLEAALASLRKGAREKLNSEEMRSAILRVIRGETVMGACNGDTKTIERLADSLSALAPRNTVDELVRLRGMMKTMLSELTAAEPDAAGDESVIDALVDVGRAATGGDVDEQLLRAMAMAEL
ncbi:hypothetical protein BDZ90DRAFT_280697 [Jaminaea rosea]|uniref:Anaphase-promoting complex subunit 1 N-terminal domain-containing protein n=1 Tax=Jaminaea rosea TaxID=1569628 RepID=A0A316UMW9_9BASI|nr:hypothetical protein BDZ90DRAFT_280697 [Jaminaea rosea]PWN26158.1 hypothetical protein BDZ90DRAFT_280697 [Jaminaea rosea]